MTYTIGQSVKRIEDRPQVSAIVLAIEAGPDGSFLELAYEEGGSGWWPESALEPAEPDMPTPPDA